MTYDEWDQAHEKEFHAGQFSMMECAGECTRSAFDAGRDSLMRTIDELHKSAHGESKCSCDDYQMIQRWKAARCEFCSSYAVDGVHAGNCPKRFTAQAPTRR